MASVAAFPLQLEMRKENYCNHKLGFLTFLLGGYNGINTEAISYLGFTDSDVPRSRFP